MATEIKQHILLLGGTGFIGRVLGKFLHQAGYPLQVISRQTCPALPYPARLWQTATGGNFPATALLNCQAVINLAGESLANGRWTKAKKARIISSRLQTTSALVKALQSSTTPTPLLIQASATGYYGDTGARETTEELHAGEGFLAETAQAWESHALQANIPAVVMRLGMVLGKSGGAFPLLASIYKFGLGAVLGTGRQHVCWIHVDDVCAFVLWALQDKSLRGVFNLVAPQSPTFLQLHHAFAKCSLFTLPVRVPTKALQLLLGDKSQMLTASQHIVPARLLQMGFQFKYKSIEDTLQEMM